MQTSVENFENAHWEEVAFSQEPISPWWAPDFLPYKGDTF